MSAHTGGSPCRHPRLCWHLWAGRWGWRVFGCRAVSSCWCWTPSSQRRFPLSQQRYSPKGLRGANGCSSMGAGLLCSSWGASGSTGGPRGSLLEQATRAAIPVSTDQSFRLASALHHRCQTRGKFTCKCQVACKSQVLAEIWSAKTKGRFSARRESRAPRAGASRTVSGSSAGGPGG